MEVELCHLGVEANKMYSPEKHVQICGQECDKQGYGANSQHAFDCGLMQHAVCTPKGWNNTLTIHMSRMWRFCNSKTSEWHVNCL